MSDRWLRARWRRMTRGLAATALAAGSTVLALGAGTGPATAAPAAVSSGVAVGYAHTCAIRTDATLWCWGGNYSGQLGDGTTASRSAPVRVGDAATSAGIDAGTSYTCGVRADGSLGCWGNN